MPASGTRAAARCSDAAGRAEPAAATPPATNMHASARVIARAGRGLTRAGYVRPPGRVGGVWEEITGTAAAESAVWGRAVLPGDRRRREPVFSPLGPERHALALETIYEGYLVHYGTPRLFAPPDGDIALLLGDYLYAHGLVRVAEAGDVAAVADLAELISLCAQGRAQGRDGDGMAWAATASLLGEDALSAARARLRLEGSAVELERVAREAAGDGPVDDALAAHARLVG